MGRAVCGGFPLRRLCHLFPGWRRARRAVSGETRAGRCRTAPERTGTVPLSGSGTAAEGLISRSPWLEGSSQVAGWEECSLPLPCTQNCYVKGWTRGPGGCASAGSSQKHPGEVGGNGAHGTHGRSVEPRCPAGGWMLRHRVREHLSPTAFPCTCPAVWGVWGFSCAASGTVLWSVCGV